MISFNFTSPLLLFHFFKTIRKTNSKEKTLSEMKIEIFYYSLLRHLSWRRHLSIEPTVYLPRLPLQLSHSFPHSSPLISLAILSDETDYITDDKYGLIVPISATRPRRLSQAVCSAHHGWPLSVVVSNMSNNVGLLKITMGREWALLKEHGSTYRTVCIWLSCNFDLALVVHKKTISSLGFTIIQKNFRNFAAFLRSGPWMPWGERGKIYLN